MRGELFAQDRVGFTHGFQAVAGDRARTAHTESRSREWLAVDHIFRQPELSADNTNLVLKQELDRLDQLKIHLLRKPADVVMRFDRSAFQNIRIDRSLREKLDAVQLSRFLGKNIYKLGADDLPLDFRIGDVCQLAEKTI